MSVVELREKMSVLNAEVTKINSLRNQNLGKKETLERQCKEMLDSYKAKFGVDLTPDTVSAELEKVMQEKSKEVNILSSVIEALSTGDYDRANAIIEASKEAPVTEIASGETVDAFANQIKIEDKITEAVATKPVSAPSITPFVVEPPKVVSKPVVDLPAVAIEDADSDDLDTEDFDPEDFELPEIEVAAPSAPEIRIAEPPTISIDNAFGGFIAPPPAFAVPVTQKNAQKVTKPAETPALTGMESFKSNFSLPALDVIDEIEDKPVMPAKPKNFGEIVGGSFFNN